MNSVKTEIEYQERAFLINHQGRDGEWFLEPFCLCKQRGNEADLAVRWIACWDRLPTAEDLNSLPEPSPFQTLENYSKLPLFNCQLDGKGATSRRAIPEFIPNGVVIYGKTNDGQYFWTMIPKETP